MRLLVSLLLVLAAARPGGAAWREGDPVRVGVYTLDWPYAYVDEANEITGSGPELARAVCGYAGVQCEMVPMTVLDDRIASLQNGTVDVLFASLAVTPERAELVDYLRPFYDASDLSLVALDSQADKLAADGTFAGLAGQRLCVVAGDAAIAHVKQFDAILVEAPTRDDVVGKLVAGDCVAVVDGSYGLDLQKFGAERFNATLVTLPSTEPIAPGAAGAAVAKGQGGSELALRLTGGLVAAASRGNDSDVLQLEEEFLIPNGIPPNAVLRRLVETLTDLV